MKYIVTIQKTFDFQIEIKAKDEDKARQKALEMFEEDEDDFEEVHEDFDVIDVSEGEK